MTADADPRCHALAAWLIEQWGAIYQGDPFPLRDAPPVGVAAAPDACLQVWRDATGQKRVEVSDMCLDDLARVKRVLEEFHVSTMDDGAFWRVGDGFTIHRGVGPFLHRGRLLRASCETTHSQPGVVHWSFTMDGRTAPRPSSSLGDTVAEIKASLTAWADDVLGR